MKYFFALLFCFGCVAPSAFATSETLPLQIDIMVHPASPATAQSFDVTVSVTPLMNGRDGRLDMQAEGATVLKPNVYKAGEVRKNIPQKFTGKITVKNERAILTADFKMTGEGGETVSNRTSLYFVTRDGKTHYAQGGFITADMMRLEDERKSWNLPEALKERRYQEEVRKLVSTTVPLDDK